MFKPGKLDTIQTTDIKPGATWQGIYHYWKYVFFFFLGGGA